MSKTSRMNKARQEKQEARDKGGSGSNKTGEQRPTQKNEGQRTPESRNDRESHIGSDSQTQARRGAGGEGH